MLSSAMAARSSTSPSTRRTSWEPFREGRALEGPSALVDALGYVSGAEVSFYWVLPRDRYVERCKKSAPKTKRLALQGGGSVSVRHFAICVPFGDTEHSTPLREPADSRPALGSS